MLEYVCEQATQCAVPPALIAKIELSCEEAIVNIISYAFPTQPGYLDIACGREGARFEVVVRDRGHPFNPIESKIDPQLNVSLVEREVGGLGIFLIRQLMDESTYQRIDQENVLRMAIRL